jgi:hypothetical protein
VASDGTQAGVPSSEPRLLQLRYRDDPWKLAVSCCLLNQTSRRQVDKVIGEIFGRWPTAESMANADPKEIEPVIRSLGFGNRRSEALVRMSQDKLKHKSFDQWFGVGKYAWDSYMMFVLNQRERIDVHDKELLRWQAWYVGGGWKRYTSSDLRCQVCGIVLMKDEKCESCEWDGT